MMTYQPLQSEDPTTKPVAASEDRIKVLEAQLEHERRCVALLEALQDGFQPIETAPKDGTVIGVWTDHQRPVIRIVRWGWHLNNMKDAQCWVTVSKSIAISRQPTHWIALGALPWEVAAETAKDSK